MPTRDHIEQFRRLRVCAGFVCAGCATPPPPAPERPPEPPAVSVSPPPAAERLAPAQPESEVPEAPWSVSYHDGSGNAFELAQKSNSEGARFEYSPVKPEQSSSGTYSGGEPAAGTLEAEQVADLWKCLLRLQAETTLHTKERGKGTGAFRIVTPSGERSFIVMRGDLLRELDEILAELKKPALR